ncbi:unnamed protein product [Spirodela intermedia]|uniref:Uncharacterized protein n=1 Tax=Spirodela intermedia TaxID=51605 RepID=A0A7I8I9J2_SPIIN|nr:unnamed protein product [Spirodela intermedia]CAA6654093.1 unnamed protein product [Spirodela intermedia]
MDRVEPSVDSPAGAGEPNASPRRQRQTSPDGPVLDLEGVVVHVKSAREEEGLLVALEELEGLVHGNMVPDEVGGNVVAVLLDRVGSVEKENRLKIFSLLRSLASQNDVIKEKMAEIGSLSVIVPSLIREITESRAAAGLLSDLLGVSSVSRRMGRVQGCILMLVTLLNGEDHLASADARKILDALSVHTQNVLLMAEAGYFKPMLHYLKRGSDMNKILMATAISRTELTEQKKVALGDGSIGPLTEMFTSGKLEAKLCALAAIQKLCSSGVNLLYSVTSVQMTLREPAAALLASMAESRSILKRRSLVRRMLSLLSTSNSVIQSHLLRALNNIASHPRSLKMRLEMKENGAVELLLPLLLEDTELRRLALRILFNISRDLDLTAELTGSHLDLLVNVITTSRDQDQKAAACGVLSNIPTSDKKSTEALSRANLLPVLLSLLEETISSSSTPSSALALEGITGVLTRFTVPWDKNLQRTAAELGAIPLLVRLLSEEKASPVVRSRAATSLAQLSQNSLSLSKAKAARWACVPSSETFCQVHGCRCSPRTTFCIEKAGARGADEAALEALATLLQDETCESGIDVLEKNSGVHAIIRVLQLGSPRAQEKALWILERVFRNEGCRGRYGPAAQVLLIDLAREGNHSLKPMIGQILAHLQLLPLQPNYF